MTRQLLKGIRVLDFTDFLAGPYCGMYLADMGADVIKVENLTTGGNFVRNARPLEKNSGLSMYFQNLNRNKRGVAINLKTEDGKKLFSELVKSADVLLENNRPGVMGRLGFSYEECKKLNPRLVYASISGFGQYGLNANRPGYDLIGQAIAMPYVFTSWDHVLTFADSDVAATLNTAIEKQGMTILGWAANGFRVVTSNNEINSPADFSGLKVRVGSAKLIADMLTALNANPTTLSMSDTYSGLQTGIVSAQENPTSNIIGSKFYEVQKYLAVTHHQYVSEPLIMNKAKFDSLSPELQQILLDAAKEVCAADVKTVSESEASDLKFIEEQGVTITYPDLTAFEEALAPVTESYCKQYGDEFTALYNQLKG